MLPLDSELRRALAERIRYYNELGIYDFYRRESQLSESPTCPRISQSEQREEMTPRRSAVAVSIPMKVGSIHHPPGWSMAPTIQHKRCESFVRISAIALAASCINKGVSRSFLVWAIPAPSLCSSAKLRELTKTNRASRS